MNNNDHELLTVKEVASWLRLSLAEVYRLIRSSELSHYRVGPGSGAIRVRRDDINAFLNKRRKGPKPEPEQSLQPAGLKHIKRSSVRR